MKRIILLVLIVLLALASLAPDIILMPGRKVLLHIRNVSGDTVYISLQGKYYKAHYYLTIPDGEDASYTLLQDVYVRTTWACGGIKNTGYLVSVSKTNLTFTRCFRFLDNFGEPGHEKVVYFPYYYWKFDHTHCGWWINPKVKKYKAPVGCWFHYQY